jgi:hypothetical protein
MVMVMMLTVITMRPGQRWVVVVVSVAMIVDINVIMMLGHLSRLLDPPHPRTTNLVRQVGELFHLIL